MECQALFEGRHCDAGGEEGVEEGSFLENHLLIPPFISTPISIIKIQQGQVLGSLSCSNRNATLSIPMKTPHMWFTFS